MRTKLSQAERLLRLLENANGDWVPAYLMPQVSLSYTRRITELRKTHTIELLDEWIDGQRRTAYRLVK